MATLKIRLLGSLVSILLAVVGTVILIVYVQNADRRAQAGMEPVTVLLVKAPVPAGTAVSDLREFVEPQTIPKAAVASDAVRKLGGLKGRITSVDLYPGEQLLKSRIVDPESAGDNGRVPVPKGLQEVTFALEPQRIIGGQINAGDTVGVFISFEKGADPEDPEAATTQLLFHKVLVTAVQGVTTGASQEENSSSETAPAGDLLVTLAQSSDDAAKTVFGAEFGTVWLSNEPLDAVEGDGAIIKKTEIYQ